jgi:hypothetical protein
VLVERGRFIVELELAAEAACLGPGPTWAARTGALWDAALLGTCRLRGSAGEGRVGERRARLVDWQPRS